MVDEVEDDEEEEFVVVDDGGGRGRGTAIGCGGSRWGRGRVRSGRRRGRWLGEAVLAVVGGGGWIGFMIFFFYKNFVIFIKFCDIF